MDENLQKLRDLALKLVGHACQCDLLNGYSCLIHEAEREINEMADDVQRGIERRHQLFEDGQGTIEILEEKVAELDGKLRDLPVSSMDMKEILRISSSGS